jgi:hypothetical protein
MIELMDHLLKYSTLDWGFITETCERFALSKNDQKQLTKALKQLLQHSPTIFGIGLYIDHKLCVGNSAWLEELVPTEMCLISSYLRALNPALYRDIPVFLPYFSDEESEAGKVLEKKKERKGEEEGEG